MKNSEDPSLINIDQSGANTAGVEDYNKKHETEIEIRQCKYSNNIVEQDHRNIKRRIRLMLGFKSFLTARIVLAGIELVHMLKKRSIQNAQKGFLNELRQSILLTCCITARNRLRKPARPKYKSLNATEPWVARFSNGNDHWDKSSFPASEF